MVAALRRPDSVDSPASMFESTANSATLESGEISLLDADRPESTLSLAWEEPLMLADFQFSRELSLTGLLHIASQFVHQRCVHVQIIRESSYSQLIHISVTSKEICTCIPYTWNPLSKSQWMFVLFLTPYFRTEASPRYTTILLNFLYTVLDHGYLSKSTTMKRRTLQPQNMPHIGIVGAGVSGLRCAEILIQKGFKVTILEGRNRLGGRMCQHRLPSGHLVDLGPNWIHGSVDNPILEMAKRIGSVTHTWEETPSLYDESGLPLSSSESSELSETMWGIVLEAFEHSNKNTSTINSKESLYDFFLTKVEERYPSPDAKPDLAGTAVTEAEQARKRRLVLQIANLWGAFVGSPVYKQTLKFFWLEECIDGENLFCADTYEKVLAQIAKTAVANSDIHYSTEVKKIISEPQEGQVEKVTIETVQGDQFQFDEIVMTAPLGWLHKHQDAFVPALPDRLSKAINSIGYGCLEKVYVTFPNAFWQGDSKTKNQINGEVAREAGAVNGNKDSGDSNDRGSAGFAQCLSPAYAKNNPERWSQEIVNLASLPASCAQPTLLFYIFGEQSKAQSAELARLKDEAERERYLVDFYKPYYSILPNYTETDPNCQPENIYATNWLRDDLAGNGSYSNFQVGLEEGDEDIITMREGVPGRGVWFAGEHTAPFVALGTVTGAYWSGELIAKKVAGAYGLAEGASDIEIGTGIEIADGKKDKEVNVRGFADKGLET